MQYIAYIDATEINGAKCTEKKEQSVPLHKLLESTLFSFSLHTLSTIHFCGVDIYCISDLIIDKKQFAL